MSLLLILLAIASIGVAGWGFQSVMAELAKSYPQEPVDTISRRFEVDEFIWGPRAPLALQRQFIATQACGIPGFLCLAALVWLNEPRPDVRIFGTIAFCSVSFLVAASLAWKTFRRAGVKHSRKQQDCYWQILLQKSFSGGERKFLEPLMRLTRGDARDLIVSHKNDHGPSYRRYRVLQC
jgi:hypothetical protein